MMGLLMKTNKARFWDLETEIVVAFTVDWGDDINWWWSPD